MIEAAIIALIFALFGVPTWGASFLYFARKAVKSRMAVTICLAGLCLVFLCFHVFMMAELLVGERILVIQAMVAALSFLASVGTLITIKHVEKKVRKGVVS